MCFYQQNVECFVEISINLHKECEKWLSSKWIWKTQQQKIFIKVNPPKFSQKKAITVLDSEEISTQFFSF